MFIKQAVLREIIVRRKVLKDMKKDIEKLESGLVEMEGMLIYQLESGAVVEDGGLKAGVNSTFKRNVAWKEKLAQICGPNEVDRILADTEPTETKKLVIVGETNRVIV